MFAQLLIRSLLGAVFFVVLLFVPAGTWAWPQGWATSSSSALMVL